VRTIRGPEDFAAAFDVSRETIERLVLYERLLRQWQKAVNLVAPGTLDAVWHRHFADSAQFVPLAPADVASWIDLGSGAGFPGLVAAILLASSPSPRFRGEGQHKASTELGAAPHPNPLPAEGRGEGTEGSPRVTLIESDTRKCAFLREVARQTGIAVDILSTRAESATIQANLPLPRVVSARALAPLDRLLALAALLAPPGTTLLLGKGKEVEKELRAAEGAWNFKVALVPSVTDNLGRIVVITNLEPKAKD
jgi:16S rRNA (guanine527-N7)-methyltransferase